MADFNNLKKSYKKYTSTSDKALDKVASVTDGKFPKVNALANNDLVRKILPVVIVIFLNRKEIAELLKGFNLKNLLPSKTSKSDD